MSKIERSGFSMLKGIDGVFKYPVEALLSVTFFIIAVAYYSHWDLLGLLSPHDSSDAENTFLVAMGMYFPLLVLSLSFNRLGWKWLYYLSFFLWIPILLWGYDMDAIKVVACIVLALILLLLVCRERNDNESYARSLSRVAVIICYVGLAVVGLFGVIYLLLITVEWLFDLNFSYETIPYLFSFCSLVAGTALFLFELHDDDGVSPVLAKGLVFLIAPLLSVYTLILYVYGIRILVRWELPKGGVAFLVCAFLIVGLIGSILNELSERRFSKWFFKWFPVISIPLVVLLWVGIVRRVGDYGLTEARVYLLLTAGTLTIFLILSFFEKTRVFSIMSLILAGSIILFTFIPGITAKDVAIYQQEARFKNAQSFLENTGADHDPDDQEWKDAMSRADDAYEFLRREMDSQQFYDKYGLLPPHRRW